MPDQNILIVGGNGLIGTYLLKKLQNDYNTYAISHTKNLKIRYFFQLDLTDYNKVREFAKNSKFYDVIIFLTGLAHSKGKGKDFTEFKKINYQTLVNLLSALEDNNKIPDKIIFSSSISVYGEKYHKHIHFEDSDKNPFSPYAVTKLAAEKFLLENYADQSWILRFAPVYSTDFLLNINRRTQTGNSFYRVGEGEKKLSLCNIENIKTAVDGVIQGNVPPGIYNLSDAKEYTYNDLLSWCNANKVIRVPQFAVKILYFLGKIINNTFLKENTVKLITDNIFPSDKIRSFIDLPATLDDIKPVND